MSLSFVNSDVNFGMEDKTSSIPHTYAYDMNESEWSKVLCDHGFKLKNWVLGSYDFGQ